MMENHQTNNLLEFCQSLPEPLLLEPIDIAKYQQHFSFKIPKQILDYDFIQNFFASSTTTPLFNSNKKSWTDPEFMVLIWVVIKYSQKNSIDLENLVDQQNIVKWNEIAAIIQYKGKNLCIFKWLSTQRTNIADKPWTEEEDNLLLDIIKSREFALKWNEIVQEMYIRSQGRFYRKGKQYRERWNNYLNPQINRGIWTPQEDIQLLQLAIQLGLRWSAISKKIRVRTENAVKNRYKSLMTKEKKYYSQVKQEDNQEYSQEELIQRIIKRLQASLEAQNNQHILYQQQQHYLQQQQYYINILAQQQMLQGMQYQIIPPLFNQFQEISPLISPTINDCGIKQEVKEEAKSSSSSSSAFQEPQPNKNRLLSLQPSEGNSPESPDSFSRSSGSVEAVRKRIQCLQLNKFSLKLESMSRHSVDQITPDKVEIDEAKRKTSSDSAIYLYDKKHIKSSGKRSLFYNQVNND